MGGGSLLDCTFIYCNALSQNVKKKFPFKKREVLLGAYQGGGNSLGLSQNALGERQGYTGLQYVTAHTH